MTPLVLGALWVLAATATAFLPMPRQMIPGLALLIAAPVLLVWIGLTHGWLWVGFGLFAFVSMFRKPLRYFALRAMGARGMSATLALAAGLIWLIVANVLAMFPSKDYHWSNAYKLIAVGVPILIWVAVSNGLIWAAAFLIAAGSVLRWPLVYLGRWFRNRLG